MASSRTANNTFTNATATDFRLWGKFISDNLELGGILKTTDTGQIAWATVAAPTVVATSQGYEIRRFSDALQATKPIFFKIEYGSGGAIAQPSIWITIGTGSDGAGNITGVLVARLQVATAQSTTTATIPYAVSAGTSRFMVALAYTNNTLFYFLGMERTKNADGTDSDLGFLFQHLSASSGVNHFQIIPFIGLVPPIETSANILIPASGTTVLGTNVGIFPMNMFYFGETVYNGMNLFGYRTTDISTDVVVTAEAYGVNRTFLTAGALMAAFFISSRNSSSVMMRFE